MIFKLKLNLNPVKDFWTIKSIIVSICIFSIAKIDFKKNYQI